MNVRGLLILLLLLAAPVRAQQQYLGAVAGSVRLSEGANSADLPLLKIHNGDRITRENIRDSIQALMDTGHYQYVEVEANAGPTGVDVIFQVRAMRYFSTFRLEPSKLLERPLSAYSRLPLGEKFSTAQVEKMRLETVHLLENNGYFNPTVTVDYPESDNPLLVTVVYKAMTAPTRATIGTIDIQTQQQTFTDREIREALDLKTGDEFQQEKVDQSVAAVRKLFANRGKNFGFLNTHIQAVPMYVEATNTVNLNITLDPGRLTLVEVNPPKVPDKKLRDMVPVFEEGTIDDDLIEEGRVHIVEYLQRDGYFEAVVTPQPPIETPEQAVQINYDIVPGPRHTVRGIHFEGRGVFDGKPCFSDDQLKRRMKIKEAGFPSLFNRGLYTSELLMADKATIQTMYRNAGFEGTIVDGHPEEDTNHVISVYFEIHEGTRSPVESIAFTGNMFISEAQLRSRLARKAPQVGEWFSYLPGLWRTPNGGRRDEDSQATPVCQYDPARFAATIVEHSSIYSPALISEARSALTGLYYEQGFPDIRVTPTIDRDADGGVNVTFQIEEGERHEIGQILVAGNTLTASKVVRRNSRLKPYAPYNPEEILKEQQRLYATGLFNRVDIVPLEEDAGFIRNLLVQVEDAKPILVTYGFGVREFDGPRVTIDVTHNNLWGLDRTLNGQVRYGLRDRQFQATYAEPQLLNHNIQGYAQVFIEKARRPLFEANTVNFQLQVVRSLSSPEAKVLNNIVVTASYETVNLQDINFNPTARLVPDQKGIIQISGVSVSFLSDWRDDPINPQRGKFTTTTFQLANKALGSEINFVSFFNQTNYYHPVGRGVLAIAERVGWKVPYTAGKPTIFDKDLPINERYFAGGSTTLRGFGQDQAGPTAPIVVNGQEVIVPGGGQMMTIGNLEWRVPLALPNSRGIRQLGGALFYDTGNVFERPSAFTFNDFTHSVGAGLRFQTPLGPLRFDVGVNLFPKVVLLGDGSPSQEQRVHVFFTLGHTF